MNSPDQIDDDAAKAKEERRASSMPKLASPSVNKKALVGCTVLGVVGTIVGVAIGGAAEHKQQQDALAAINGGGGTNPSKSGKSGPFCDTEPSVVCGQTVTGTAVLNEDLFCTDLIDCSTPDVVTKTLNAAIKVVGADAVIDCKGHTVRQLTSKSAASCEYSPGALFTNSNKRKEMKEEYDLFYQAGIWLADGATAINCNVEHFYDGFLVQNGGEVKKSEASRNRGGVDILDDTGSMTKISVCEYLYLLPGLFIFDFEDTSQFTLLLLLSRIFIHLTAMLTATEMVSAWGFSRGKCCHH